MLNLNLKLVPNFDFFKLDYIAAVRNEDNSNELTLSCFGKLVGAVEVFNVNNGFVEVALDFRSAGNGSFFHVAVKLGPIGAVVGDLSKTKLKATVAAANLSVTNLTEYDGVDVTVVVTEVDNVLEELVGTNEHYGDTGLTNHGTCIFFISDVTNDTVGHLLEINVRPAEVTVGVAEVKVSGVSVSTVSGESVGLAKSIVGLGGVVI